MINTDGMTIEQRIIAQACDDYRTAIRKGDEKLLADVMQFFRSAYFNLMTKANYTYLIAKLDKEWSDGKKLIEAGNKIECPELKKNYKYVCPLCGGKAKVKETVNKKGTHFRSYSCKDCKISEKQLFCLGGKEDLLEHTESEGKL